MDRDQNEVVENILQPSLKKSLLDECKILEVKRENDLRYHFTRKHPSELRNWSIFNLLNSEFISQIYMVMIFELLALSNLYCETKLEKHCSELIKPRITVSNVILVYKTAIQCSVKDLEECSLQVILNHSTVVFLKEFVNLDYDMQLDLTLKVAKARGFKT